MATKGEETRARILDAAQRLILQHGDSGTSIDEIVYESDITKGGFFYHFKNRNDLAHALMVRYIEDDDRILTDLFEQSSQLVDDPFQRMLAFLKLYADLLASMDDVHPGCLVAAYTYESQQFDPEVRKLTREGITSWKEMFVRHFEAALTAHETDVPVEDLADMLNALVEGGIILSRIEGNNEVLARQVLLFRDYVKRVFRPRTPAEAAS